MEQKSIFAHDGTYARIMNRLWNYIVISILWVLLCIPVVTVGAASSAAYYTAAKVIRGREGKAVTEFFHAFKINFRQSLPFSLGFAVVLIWLLADTVYLYRDASVPLSVLYLFYGLILMALACAQYLFGFLSRFTLGKLALLRMSVLGTFRHLISTILLLLLLAVTAVGIYLMPWGIFLFPGLMFWLKTYLMEPVMRKYMATPEEGDPEGQKWYYNI